jgi:hypothetical protein
MTGNVQLYLPDGNRKAVPTPDGRAHSETGVRGQVNGRPHVPTWQYDPLEL